MNICLVVTAYARWYVEFIYLAAVCAIVAAIGHRNGSWEPHTVMIHEGNCVTTNIIFQHLEIIIKEAVSPLKDLFVVVRQLI